MQNDLLTQKEQADNGFARLLLSMPTEAEDMGENYGQLDLALREVEF